MTKITKESIEEILIPKGWEKDEYSKTDIYESPDGKCELHYWDKSTISETGFGWMIFIYNSRHESLGCCDVEYIEQIFALIDIYKDY